MSLWCSHSAVELEMERDECEKSARVFFFFFFFFKPHVCFAHEKTRAGMEEEPHLNVLFEIQKRHRKKCEIMRSKLCVYATILPA